jgi:hypothetical protein
MRSGRMPNAFENRTRARRPPTLVWMMCRTVWFSNERL